MREKEIRKNVREELEEPAHKIYHKIYDKGYQDGFQDACNQMKEFASTMYDSCFWQDELKKDLEEEE